MKVAVHNVYRAGIVNVINMKKIYLVINNKGRFLINICSNKKSAEELASDDCYVEELELDSSKNILWDRDIVTLFG